MKIRLLAIVLLFVIITIICLLAFLIPYWLGAPLGLCLILPIVIYCLTILAIIIILKLLGD